MIKLIPTIITLPIFASLIWLGNWQLERLEWKRDLIVELEEKLIAPPVRFSPEMGRDRHLEYRRVNLSGYFVHDKEMLISSRVLEGNVGYDVVTPFKIMGANRYILIHRGWIPLSKKKQHMRLSGLTSGAMKVHGSIRFPKKRGFFVPDNMPQENLWFFIELQEMKTSKNLPNLEKFYVKIGRSDGNTYPVGYHLHPKVSNHHIYYAITWYTLALALVILYYFLHRSK